MTLLKQNLSSIKKGRESLEAMGLLRTYVKEGSVNEYVYELYSPLSAKEFFAHPIFNVVLYNNIGKYEYELLKKQYEKFNISLEGYTDITSSINEVYEPTTEITSFEVKDKNTLIIEAQDQIDFDLLLETIPKNLLNERALNKRVRTLINNLSFVYDIDTLKMGELIRAVIADKGMLDKDELRKVCGKYYRFNSGGLPTLVYRSQPDYLKSPIGDNSPLGKMIAVFENTTPYDFLSSKYGSKPTARDLNLLESLLNDVELPPAVVNVLIDYVLKKNDNKLNAAFVETIAGQWKRAKLSTAKEAMEYAKKSSGKTNSKTKTSKQVNPEWFDKDNKSEKVSETEEQELKDLLKEFR
jgi:replication initiation and membrane attachment protein